MEAQEPSTGRIKGAAFREFLVWYRASVGQERFSLMAADLPPTVLEHIDPLGKHLGVLPSTWYPAPVVHSLLDVLTAGHNDEARKKLAFEASAAVMARTLRGFYRFFFQIMATPERYAKHCGKLWGSYYDSGRFEVSMPSKTLALCTVSDWSTHHPFICELNWGAAGEIYRAMGCTNVLVDREACVDVGGRECRFVTTWD